MTIRLFVIDRLVQDRSFEADQRARHYLVNVMRQGVGGEVLLVNGVDGEWCARIAGIRKRSLLLVPIRQMRRQIQEYGPTLMFAPIKRSKLAWLIEKSVELGVGCLQPVVTQHTDARLDRTDRIARQIIEAVEQSERLSAPTLAPAIRFEQLLDDPGGPPILVGLARRQSPSLMTILNNVARPAFLVGPEGGFSDQETGAMLDAGRFTPVRLADTVLRAETAALAFLSVYRQWSLQNVPGR